MANSLNDAQGQNLNGNPDVIIVKTEPAVKKENAPPKRKNGGKKNIIRPAEEEKSPVDPANRGINYVSVVDLDGQPDGPR